jgi:hypothetical protein
LSSSEVTWPTPEERIAIRCGARGRLEGGLGLIEGVCYERQFGFELGQEVRSFLQGAGTGLILDSGAEFGHADSSERARATAEVVGAIFEFLGIVASGGGFHFTDGGGGVSEEEVDEFGGGADGAGLAEAVEEGDGVGIDGIRRWDGAGLLGFGLCRVGWRGEFEGRNVLGGALEGLHQGFDADGFADVVVHARLEAAFAGAAYGVSGHGDDIDAACGCGL